MLRVIDNSGASKVQCFNILRNRKIRGTIGDIIVGSVKETKALSDTMSNSRVQKVQKGQVVRGVIVRTKKEIKRDDGTCVAFDDNAVVLVDVDKKKGIIPKGTRITGVVSQELRRRGMTKILSLAPAVI